MKKIAILTQPLKTNYGGILQNYALQKTLKDLGHQPITIDIDYIKYSNVRIFLSQIKNRIVDKIQGKKKKYFSDAEIKIIAKNSRSFIQNQINCSEKIINVNHLKSHFNASSYQTVIVGSDQTWRPKYSQNIFNYFLDFLQGNSQINKIAYASSFGTSEWEFNELQTESCAKLAKKFNAISVREDSGVELCKQYLGIKAELVLDPTLLVDKEQYIKLFSSLELSNNIGGLYTYVLDRNADKNLIIEKVSNKLNALEYKNQPKASLEQLNSQILEDYVFPEVESWIKGFYDADYVITDSFHGTVFSILFNKPFIAIANEERGASRFISLLKQFGLENRLISNAHNITDEFIEEKIDYEIVNKRLLILKQKSLEFLSTKL